jgi:hypothetical protein
MAMKRTLFHIPQDQLDRLHALAVERQVSTGELVRRFLDQGLSRFEARSDMRDKADLVGMQQQLVDLVEVVHMLESRVAALEQRTL